VSPEVWLAKAIAQSYTGDNEAAIVTVSAMVRKFPNFPKMDEVSMLAAELHLDMGKYAKAAAYVHHASISGRGSSYYSQMDLIMIAGRINERWYESLDGGGGGRRRRRRRAVRRAVRRAARRTRRKLGCRRRGGGGVTSTRSRRGRRRRRRTRPSSGTTSPTGTSSTRRSTSRGWRTRPRG
jgi:hypothetical protein